MHTQLMFAENFEITERNYALEYLIQRTNVFDFDVYLPSKGKNLQRPFCWQEEAIKNGFDEYHYHRLLIDSHSNRNNIGMFVFYNDWTTNKLQLKVIDGKQRIKAFNDFVENKFAVVRDGQEMFFSDFHISVRRRFLNTGIVVNELNSENHVLTDNELLELFLKINNGGVPQSENHLNNLKSLL